MYITEDNNIMVELKSASNFSYVLQNDNVFLNTDFKVLQSQNNGLFVPCVKMTNNGKVELLYITEDYISLAALATNIEGYQLHAIITKFLEAILEVKNNGFLKPQNIDISWNKIYVDKSTNSIKFVYLPLSVNCFDNFHYFENAIKGNLLNLINSCKNGSETFAGVCDALASDASLDNILQVMKFGEFVKEPTEAVFGSEPIYAKLVAINAPVYCEVVIDRPEVIIGKKKELVDVAITFNKAISRRHCRIINRDNKYMIVDEDSANGTYVNGAVLTPHQYVDIKKGDTITLANTDFIFE